MVGVLKEKWFEKSRVGTIGMSDGWLFSPKGWLSHNLYKSLTDSLPGVEWVPMGNDFARLWLVKSTEDQAIFKHAAAIVESVCDAVVHTARSGVTEREVYSATMGEIFRHRATAPGAILHSGKNNVGHYMPKWLYRAQEPRTLESGDEIHMELAVNWTSAHVQAQMAIAVGEVEDDVRKAGAWAREAYEICLKELKPGIPFAEVPNAMRAPLEREGAWQLTPMIHSMCPGACVDEWGKGVGQDMTGLKEAFKDFAEGWMCGSDIVLQPGMIFQAEANAVVGRSYVDVGGNLIVTETGCEASNEIPTDLRFVP